MEGSFERLSYGFLQPFQLHRDQTSRHAVLRTVAVTSIVHLVCPQ